MNDDILNKAGIAESWWPNCYISEGGMIFTPQFDSSNSMTKTGEQTYNEWLVSKDKTVPPTLDDRVKALEAAQLAALGV